MLGKPTLNYLHSRKALHHKVASLLLFGKFLSVSKTSEQLFYFGSWPIVKPSLRHHFFIYLILHPFNKHLSYFWPSLEAKPMEFFLHYTIENTTTKTAMTSILLNPMINYLSSCHYPPSRSLAPMITPFSLKHFLHLASIIPHCFPPISLFILSLLLSPAYFQKAGSPPWSWGSTIACPVYCFKQNISPLASDMEAEEAFFW